METSSQPNPSDSFSFNWLMNIKPSSSIDESLRFSFDSALETGSFIDMDPKLISMRWSTCDYSHDFDFNLPPPQPPATILPADQIFSDGHLLPLQYSQLNRSLSLDSCKSLLSQSSRRGAGQVQYVHATPSRQLSSPSTTSTTTTTKKTKHNKKVKYFCKYLCFLLPLYKKVKCFRFMAPARSARIYTDSVETSTSPSPRTSNVYTTMMMLDVRSESIHDAVLYCKNSNIGQGFNMNK